MKNLERRHTIKEEWALDNSQIVKKMNVSS
jgi:hypothetical protein